MQAYFCKEICSLTCGGHWEAELQKHQHHKDTIFFSWLQHPHLFWNSYASWGLQGSDSRRVVQMPRKRESCICTPVLKWWREGRKAAWGFERIHFHKRFEGSPQAAPAADTCRAGKVCLRSDWCWILSSSPEEICRFRTTVIFLLKLREVLTVQISCESHRRRLLWEQCLLHALLWRQRLDCLTGLFGSSAKNNQIAGGLALFHVENTHHHAVLWYT